MAAVRPPFEPIPCSSQQISGPALDEAWLPMLSCQAGFPPELFETALLQLIHHPEYNSTLILRSEVLDDVSHDFPAEIPSLGGYEPLRSIRRRLLPRRPGRDASLEQHCTVYAASAVDESPIASVVVLTPIFEDGRTDLPYYHPRVHHIAFRYIGADATEGTVRIEVLPLPDTPTDVSSRLYRTCLALLDTVHRYGWGAMINYQKRVIHDNLVSREPYQDLYLVMRERHKHLIDTWQEVTDPLKHVFEDIGIATYLMLLWKDTYTDGPLSASASNEPDDRPWRSWPRPPGGFADLGCGNGLLTHILVSEGYEGHGIDLRARTSWSSYPESTRSRLHVHAIDPLASGDGDGSVGKFLNSGVFIIGNHADELSPWLPVLSTLHSMSGYISIPCCAFTFDSRYQRSQSLPYGIPEPEADFVERLNLGGHGNNSSSYSMYRIWLASLSVHCGWEVECDNLRIPSTRNWALVGRRRMKDEDQAKRNVELILEVVKDRGIFKTRTPEGKGGDH